MVWLVVSAEFDDAARWAVDLLPSAGIEPVLHVTDADLGGAIWDHRIEVDGISTRLALADGRVIDSREIEAR